LNTLILKLGATGDVVRTTTLLRRLRGEITWITAEKNVELLRDLEIPVRALTWEERGQAADRPYDLVINLEDDRETALFIRAVTHERVFGAFVNDADELSYTNDARPWFDLSLISRFGRDRADALKLQNRSTYQELIFTGLGLAFSDEGYLLPAVRPSSLEGDVAISAVAGAVWPMKKWAYYDELKEELEARGFVVNFLPTRPTLLEHLADVQGHRCLVSGDSLPMHLALGSGVRCVSIFTCTSPWEIHGYGLQTKIVSPLLEDFFYKRGYEERATTAITLEEVLTATLTELDRSPERSVLARQEIR
jgi:ADP-heptose:LPS heptosyltransferase